MKPSISVNGSARNTSWRCWLPPISSRPQRYGDGCSFGISAAGLPGLFTAAISFIIPGATASLALAYSIRNTVVCRGLGLFKGINPVVAAILTAAFIRLGKSAFTDYKTGFIALASIAASFVGVSEVPIIFGGGLLGLLLYSPQLTNFLPLFMGMVSLSQAKFSAFSDIFKSKLIEMALFFLKVGALLFGSTYVLIAFMQREVVNKYHWLTYQQMLDAVAAGQITPGPISSTSTFAGYVIAGFPALCSRPWVCSSHPSLSSFLPANICPRSATSPGCSISLAVWWLLRSH
jgi:chromate transporter